MASSRLAERFEPERERLGLPGPVALVGEDLSERSWASVVGWVLCYLILLPLVAGFSTDFDPVLAPVLTVALALGVALTTRASGMVAGPDWVAGRSVLSPPLVWRWRVVRAGEITDVHLSRSQDLTADTHVDTTEGRSVVLRTPTTTLRVGAERWEEVREILRPHVSAEVSRLLTSPRSERRTDT